MTATTAVQPHPAAESRGARVRPLLLVSALFLAVQVAVTDYGTGNAAAGSGPFVVGCLLLWLVYRMRSRVARGLAIVMSLAGAIIYGLGAWVDPHAAFLMVAFLGQALPLLMSPVRRHVQS